MVIGKKQSVSPILTAIREAERGSTGEIRVHLTQRWFERDAYSRARQLFNLYQMSRTQFRNAILIYVNLRKKKFAIIGDFAIHDAVGQIYWKNLAKELQENLRSTQSEKAISLAVLALGNALREHFPDTSEL